MTDERWAQLVAEVAKLEGVAEALWREHVPDEHGACLGCRSHSVRRTWPCTLRRLAESAQARRPASTATNHLNRCPSWDR